MRLLELAVLYLMIGAGCAMGIYFARGLMSKAAMLDVALMIPFWPLYAPFMMMARAPAASAPVAVTEASILEAVTSRMAVARGRISEIDRLLREPAFDEQAAQARVRELEASGDARAAATSRARVACIRRLVVLRDRFSRELTEVDELIAQLRVQHEVVRLAGNSGEDTRELVAELMARAEGLEAILADDVPLAPSSADSGT